MPKLRVPANAGLLRGFNPPQPNSRQVKCINKKDRFNQHERITNIGGDWGIIPESLAIQQIENGEYRYHVKVGSIDVPVFVAMHLGNKYLRTEADFTKVDNLLYLEDCKLKM